MLGMLGCLERLLATGTGWRAVAGMVQRVTLLVAKEVDLGVGEDGRALTSHLALLAIDCAIVKLVRVERHLAAAARVSILRARECGGGHAVVPVLRQLTVAQHLSRDQAHLALVGGAFTARMHPFLAGASSGRCRRWLASSAAGGIPSGVSEQLLAVDLLNGQVSVCPISGYP